MVAGLVSYGSIARDKNVIRNVAYISTSLMGVNSSKDRKINYVHVNVRYRFLPSV